MLDKGINPVHCTRTVFRKFIDEFLYCKHSLLTCMGKPVQTDGIEPTAQCPAFTCCFGKFFLVYGRLPECFPEGRVGVKTAAM